MVKTFTTITKNIKKSIFKGLLLKIQLNRQLVFKLQSLATF